MQTPLLCHFLIGCPGSGKSNFAAQLAKQGNYQIISTDLVRQRLYGDESIQGEWLVIEKEVLSEIGKAIASNQPIIYDATNAKRAYRMALLTQLQQVSPNVQWIGWHLTTPLATCKAWNQNRQRQVPDAVIESMYKSLQDFPPVPAEGFADVNTINPVGELQPEDIAAKINRLSRSTINRLNRTKHSQVKLHRYSRLLDFERLLHLIALLIRYPGIGNLQQTDECLLEEIFGTVPEFGTPIEEVSAILAKLHGAIYADAKALADDLLWLEQNNLIDISSLSASSDLNDIEVETIEDADISTHAYSDVKPFQRLWRAIRFILHHPFLVDSGNGHLKTLFVALKENYLDDDSSLDSLRKDIEKVLKPYKILPEFPLRNGYFAGTAIWSRYELQKVFAVIQSQANSLDDPTALAIYETFQQRMALSKLGTTEVYPVRAIGNHCIIAPEFVQSSALSKNVEFLEQAIANGVLLELNRLAGCGRFPGDEHGFFKAWPLQIVFHNLAWYLGFECEVGKDGNLFRFERLDRLFIGQSQDKIRDLQAQVKSLEKLQRLYEASAGIFLGNNARLQQQFLSSKSSEKAAVEVTVELWFNDDKFRFISEGTKRFPANQMRMSPPRAGKSLSYPKSIFSLPRTEDAEFPNRFRVKLPCWSLDDVDLLRWIVGFGGSVKVKNPRKLMERVKGIGLEIIRVYEG